MNFLKTKKTVIVKALILITMLTGICAVSHDYVLLARNFIVKKGEKLAVQLFVAYGFNIVDEKPFDHKNTVSLKLISENGEKNLIGQGQEGGLPFIETTVDFNGLGLMHMERAQAFISIENEGFKNYIREEHIDNIYIDETKKEQTERYRRFIKTLIQSDKKANDQLYKKVIGYPYEIVLLENPYEKKKKDWLKVQILLNGKPMQNKVITARNRYKGESAIYQYSRTNSEGICTFRLEREGEWFIHSTHLFHSRDKSKSDWESYWACYSFGM